MGSPFDCIEEENELEDLLYEIKKVAEERIDNMVGKFDWYKSEDGKALLKIKGMIEEYE